MFRHADTFHNHPFHNVWKELKEQINEIDNEKFTNKNVVIEFARLNKCIAYIDAYLKIIDPDFLTTQDIGSLEKIKQYTDDILVSISQYEENDNPDYIHGSNNRIDDILDILYGFNTTLPKISERSISEMLKKYGDTVDESLSQINLPLVKEESDQIHLLKQRLIDGESDQESIKLQIENLFEDFKNKHGELNQFYDETLNPDFKNTTAELIETNQELLEKYKQNATDSVNELTNKIDEFNKFYIIVFGGKDSETGKRIGGLKAELKDRIQELDEFKESQKTECSTLTEQIKSLLPDATSAGLASAYNDERKKFENPLKLWNWVFIGSLIAMVLVTFASFVTYSPTNGWDWSFFNSTGAESVIIEHLNSLLRKLPLYLPLIWLALYASKRRSELQRLDQEYAHKEASAKSYSSYKDQIDNLNADNDTLSSKLLNSIIDSTSRNPSETLGKHSNNTPLREATKTILDTKNKQ